MILETYHRFKKGFFFNIMKKLTTQEFIEKAIKIHGDKYDYYKTIYIKSSVPSIIKCSIHGFFKQKPNNHLNGQGCPKCNGGVKYTKEQFIHKANIIHNNFYDYSNVQYLNSKEKIEIICPKHGSFLQTPNNHIKNRGCPKCGKDELANLFKKNIEDIINKMQIVHENKYSYPKITSYTNNRDKIKIFCKNHGFFEQSISGHMNKKNGCPKCKSIISKPEIEIQEYIKNLGFEILTNKRNIIKPKELDIYIPELKKAIEFNGEYWHYSKKHFIPGEHGLKSNLCRKKGIKLLHIREDLWIKDKEKTKKSIEKFLYYKN